MTAHTVIRCPDDTLVRLASGELIGRSWCASLQLDDPRLSEAHAMVSLRADRLKLLPLRGRLVVGGRRVDEVELRPGLDVLLAPDLSLHVVDVVLPATGPGLVGDGLPPTLLPGSAALAFRPEPAVTTVHAKDARAWLWTHDGGYRVRVDGTERPLPMGGSFVLEGRSFQLVELPVASELPTAERSVVDTGLRIVCRYESVHLFRQGRAPVLLDGISAQIVTELASFAAPVPWRMLGEALWGTSLDDQRLRKRLDGGLARLRGFLRKGGVREDLVRSGGRGQLELFLHPEDRVEDQS